MFKKIRGWFAGKENSSEQVKEYISKNQDYICLALEINKLEPDNPVWNLHKVREGLLSGMLRYATKKEVEEAIRDGRVKQ